MADDVAPPEAVPRPGLVSLAAAWPVWLRWLVPLTGAALAVVAGSLVRPPLAAAATAALALFGSPLAVIDLRDRRLPDALTLPCLGVVAGLLAAAACAGGEWRALLRAAAGAVAVGGLFAVLALARPGSAGLGDAKLGLSTGAVAGWFGWGALLDSVFAAFLLAALTAAGLIAARRTGLRGGSLPFGPFLLAGCLAAALLTAR
jgi:leader peptidase (prepilin peptidase) / N-methyltransferase